MDQSLHWKIECFLWEFNIPHTRFGRLVANDPNLVPDLGRGRAARPAMVKRIETYMETYRGESEPIHDLKSLGRFFTGADQEGLSHGS